MESLEKARSGLDASYCKPDDSLPSRFFLVFTWCYIGDLCPNPNQLYFGGGGGGGDDSLSNSTLTHFIIFPIPHYVTPNLY